MLGVVNPVVTAGVVSAGLVPKLVKLDVTTVEFNVVPDNPCTLGNADKLSSSTLGCTIDSVNQTWYGYFGDMIYHYWPFIVGIGVIGVAWHFGMLALSSL